MSNKKPMIVYAKFFVVATSIIPNFAQSGSSTRPLPYVQSGVRRPDRHRVRRTSSAAFGLDALPVCLYSNQTTLYGFESFQPADCRRVGETRKLDSGNVVWPAYRLPRRFVTVWSCDPTGGSGTRRTNNGGLTGT